MWFENISLKDSSIHFIFQLQINFGPVNNPGDSDTTVKLEIAFDTDLAVAAGAYEPSISVGTVDAEPSAFTVIANVRYSPNVAM